jgi:hypothetical protein
MYPLFCTVGGANDSLGLDADRRAAYPNSNSAHRDVYPRAVSMASPSRPSFFSKDSRTSIDNPRDRDPRALTKSISSSRLSQVMRNEGSEQEPKKKKGLKGLIQKMKPKSKRQSSDIPPLPQQPQYRPQPQQSDVGKLPLPPNMAFLSGDGQQRRNRNSSQSSMADSSQGSNSKMRSVSAPIGGSSSGSQSASPTSSKYRRESYNSGLRVEDDQRGATMEMLHPPNGNGQYPQRQMYTSPEPGYDDRRSSNAPTLNGNGYPNPSFRNSKYAAGSISASSGVAATLETPPMPLNATPFFSRPPSINSPATSNNVNRFKNLPPLPPTDDRIASSPDSFQILNDQQDTPNRRNMYTQPTLYPGQAPPRASFDRPTNTPRAEPSPRMVHSMYAQPTSSNLSFGSGRFPQMQQGMPHGNGYGQGYAEGEKKKKGLKGFFGGAKAGRMA